MLMGHNFGGAITFGVKSFKRIFTRWQENSEKIATREVESRTRTQDHSFPVTALVIELTQSSTQLYEFMEFIVHKVKNNTVGRGRKYTVYLFLCILWYIYVTGNSRQRCKWLG